MVSKGQEKEAFVAVLRDVVLTLSDSAGIPESLAAELAAKVVTELQLKYGSQRVYIHTRNHARKKQQILADCHRQTVDQLVEKHKVSRQWVYQVLNHR